jgi:hypothetical protein
MDNADCYLDTDTPSSGDANGVVDDHLVAVLQRETDQSPTRRDFTFSTTNQPPCGVGDAVLERVTLLSSGGISGP